MLIRFLVCISAVAGFVQSNSCFVQLRSYGGNEPILTDRVSYIAVNGQLFAQYTGLLKHIAVGILNPDTCLIQTNSIRLFNTGNASLATAQYETSNLLAYLDNVYTGAIIVGVSSDNAFGQPAALASAFNVLNAHGVFISNLVAGGKFVFVAQKGYPYKTAFSKILTASPALVLSANVETDVNCDCKCSDNKDSITITKTTPLPPLAYPAVDV